MKLSIMEIEFSVKIIAIKYKASLLCKGKYYT
jgi:hypothetical protein